MGIVKTQILPVRVSKIFKEKTQECAELAGKNLSEYIRDSVARENERIKNEK